MTEHATKYDHWAWLYDQTLGPKYSSQKIGAIEKAVLPHVPPGGNILDLCCGTGQLVAALGERGYNVTGFDGSSDMLRHARQNAPAATFIEGDARDFTLDESFDCVVCTSASLNHMQQADDLRGVFASVNRCLKPGGIFVFDVNHPAQMARYWLGRTMEGEIGADHSWAITPAYDPSTKQGSFTVDIYRRTEHSRVNPVKRLIEKVVGLNLLRRRRLALLSNYHVFRQDWEHRSVVNTVWGHELQSLEALLEDNGFEAQARSTGGGAIDERHSVYFFCRKAGVPDISPEPQLQEITS